MLAPAALSQAGTRTIATTTAKPESPAGSDRVLSLGLLRGRLPSSSLWLEDDMIEGEMFKQLGVKEEKDADEEAEEAIDGLVLVPGRAL